MKTWSLGFVYCCSSYSPELCEKILGFNPKDKHTPREGGGGEFRKNISPENV